MVSGPPRRVSAPSAGRVGFGGEPCGSNTPEAAEATVRSTALRPGGELAPDRCRSQTAQDHVTRQFGFARQAAPSAHRISFVGWPRRTDSGWLKEPSGRHAGWALLGRQLRAPVCHRSFGDTSHQVHADPGLGRHRGGDRPPSAPGPWAFSMSRHTMFDICCAATTVTCSPPVMAAKSAASWAASSGRCWICACAPSFIISPNSSLAAGAEEDAPATGAVKSCDAG